MALVSTQPLVKMSARDVPGGKGGRCLRLTWPVMGVLYLFTVYYLVFTMYTQHVSAINIYLDLTMLIMSGNG
jgi:hypothetical protein